jgi:hypothetical protein
MDKFHWLPSNIISNEGVSSVGVDESDTSVKLPGSLSFSQLVGSGTAVGGIVTAIVGGEQGVPQLQRIVSQCDCRIFYANYGGEVDKSWSKVIAMVCLLLDNKFAFICLPACCQSLSLPLPWTRTLLPV